MSSSCKSAVDCIEIHAPIRATYVNLYKWPESDAEFVKSLAVKQTREKDGADYWYHEKKRYGPTPRVVDSYSCRQMYLRSYTFSKKESVPEKTVKCLNRVKDKVPFFPYHNQNNDESFESSSSRNMSCNKKKRKKKKKKGCVIVKRVKEVSCNVVWLIFHRLLACAASVDVVDR